MDYRELKPCRECGRHVDPDCEFVRRELRQAVERLNIVASIARRGFPAGQCDWDCAAFWPRKRKETA